MSDVRRPDLIVVGAGTAGLPLAIAAAEGGAQVLILEKTDRIGGTLYRTGGNLSAGGTRRQRERGIVDSPDEHYRELMRISHGEAHPELSRLACDLAPGMIDWLDEHGFDFDPETPTITFSHEPYISPRTYRGVEPGLSILAILHRLLAPHLASGRVTIRFNTAANRLIVEDGRVVGIVAAGEELRAPAVVLTSGGFTGNPDLLARLSGGYRPISSGVPASTGDGLVMAEAIGAGIHHEGVFLPTIGAFGSAENPGFAYSDSADRLGSLPRVIPQLRPPWEIWVNAAGNRFIREDEPDIELREVAVKENGLNFWVIWASTIQRDAPPLVPSWSEERIQSELAAGTLIVSAGSIDELAATIGVPAEALGEILGFSTFSGRAHVGGLSVGPAMALGRYLGQQLAESTRVATAATSR